jgi:hypothetical protein
MLLVLWPAGRPATTQRPEMNGYWLQFADNVDFVLPVLFIVAEQAMFVHVYVHSPD